jgi:trehalose 6-phosphate phosphatase
VDVDELVAAARAALPDLLVALDFDGTLAPIVPDPQDSRPVEGTGDTLRRLAEQGADIAVITGRDAATVLELSGFASIPGLVVEGLYGADTWTGGELSTLDEPPALHALRARLPELVAEHRTDERVWIEDKRLSLVVHGRLTDDPEAALDPLREPIASLAGELGLEVHPGRGVIELRLPGFDKAAALRRLLSQRAHRFVLFAGDDVGDLPALAQVRDLRAHGQSAAGVAVVSPDVPEMGEAADVRVDSPVALVHVLRRIAEP